MNSEAVNTYEMAMLSILLGRAYGSITDDKEEEIMEVKDEAWKNMTEEERKAMNKKCKDILEKAGCLDII